MYGLKSSNFFGALKKPEKLKRNFGFKNLVLTLQRSYSFKFILCSQIERRINL